MTAFTVGTVDGTDAKGASTGEEPAGGGGAGSAANAPSGTKPRPRPRPSPSPSPSPVTAQAFRDVMACVAMPVAVVTTVDDTGRWHGATLGSVVSLSLDPPLVMFALGHGTTVHHPVCAGSHFRVSILTADQRETAERFAGPAADRFAGDIVLLDGIPAVGAAAGWLACARTDLIEAGDHTIVIGRVEKALRGPQAAAGPLLYHQRRYHRLGETAELFGAEAAAG